MKIGDFSRKVRSKTTLLVASTFSIASSLSQTSSSGWVSRMGEVELALSFVE
jgi:hypothetical protein